MSSDRTKANLVIAIVVIVMGHSTQRILSVSLCIVYLYIVYHISIRIVFADDLPRSSFVSKTFHTIDDFAD